MLMLVWPPISIALARPPEPVRSSVVPPNSDSEFEPTVPASVTASVPPFTTVLPE